MEFAERRVYKIKNMGKKDINGVLNDLSHLNEDFDRCQGIKQVRN